MLAGLGPHGSGRVGAFFRQRNPGKQGGRREWKFRTGGDAGWWGPQQLLGGHVSAATASSVSFGVGGGCSPSIDILALDTRKMFFFFWEWAKWILNSWIKCSLAFSEIDPKLIKLLHQCEFQIREERTKMKYLLFVTCGYARGSILSLMMLFGKTLCK